MSEDKLQDLLYVIRIGGLAAAGLTERNIEYIESVADQHDIKGFITDAQANVIADIWEKI